MSAKHRAIAVDLDGTLAQYDHYRGPTHIGKPIPEMVEKVKAAIDAGDEVSIFTARIAEDGTFERGVEVVETYLAVAAWVKEVFGTTLPITCTKSWRFGEFWDDRAKQVLPNTGVFLEELMEASSAHK